MTNEQPTPDELRREIEQTREELGETAAALASKTDVKARARDKVDDIKQTAAQKAGSIKEAATPSGGDAASSPGPSGIGAKAGSVADQARTKAQENPIAAAAGVAFVGGFLLGRLRSR